MQYLIPRIVSSNGQADFVELLAFLTSPGTLRIELAGKIFESTVGAGEQVLYGKTNGFIQNVAPAEPGTPRFKLIRNNVVILDVTSEWRISSSVVVQDFLYRYLISLL